MGVWVGTCTSVRVWVIERDSSVKSSPFKSEIEQIDVLIIKNRIMTCNFFVRETFALNDLIRTEEKEKLKVRQFSS